jgi:hypothetical protein
MGKRRLVMSGVGGMIEQNIYQKPMQAKVV